jgi:Flp pilus assembly protein TadG
MMVLYALALPALIGAIALGADVAVMYVNWQGMQKAADAAVLAGGGSLPNDTTQATADCNAYLTHNGVTGNDTVTGPTFGTKVVANDTITVTVKRNVPYLFAQVLGLLSSDVQVTATAWVQPSSSVGNGVVPIALPDTTPMDPQQLYGSGSQVSLTASYWGGLVLDGMVNSSVAPDIASGYPGTVSIGDHGTLSTGLSNGPIKQAFDDRGNAGLAMDSWGTWDHHMAGDPRGTVIPLVNGTPVPGGGSPVTITGFVCVWLVGPPWTTGNGNGADALSINGILYACPASANPGGEGTPPAGAKVPYYVVLIN